MALSFVWMLILLVATLYFIRRPPKLSLPKYAPWILLGIALLVRLIPSALLAGTSNYDIDSFHLTAEVLASGGDIYTSTETKSRHPYLPMQMYALDAANRLAARLRWPFPFTVRLLPIAIDAILAFWLFMLLKKQISEDEAFRWGMVYALNPVTIFISAIHGQFDTLPTMLTLAALLSIPSSAWKTGVFLGLGILNKSWPVLAWPQIMSNIGSWRKRIIATLFMGMVLLAAILLYTWLFDANLLTGLQKAISYNWGIGIWGYTYFVQMALMRLPGWPGTWGWFIKISRFVTLGILAWIWFARTRFQSSVRGFLGIMLGFFALGHAFSIQYLLWPVAFAVYLQEEKWLARYIISASAYMFLVYYTLILDNVIMRLLPWPQADWYIIMPAGIPVWVVTLFWLRKSLQRPSKAPVNIG
jgi:hypothetical protein